jgi:hypothetical protein
MILDDDSGAHGGGDDDNGDDGYGIESHGEQAAIARQVRLLLDLDRLGQIIARNRSNSADRCLACARDRPSMVGTTINRRDMNHSERNYEIQQLETSRHEAAKAVCLSAAALNDASITRALNHINDERDLWYVPKQPGLDQHKAHWINHQFYGMYQNNLAWTSTRRIGLIISVVTSTVTLNICRQKPAPASSAWWLVRHAAFKWAKRFSQTTTT